MLIGLVLAPFAGAIIMPILFRCFGKKASYVAPLLPLVLLAAFLSLLPQVLKEGALTAAWHWAPSLGIDLSFRLDGLSLLFVLLITGIGLAVMIYSLFYLSAKERLANFYTFIFLFMGAMLGVCTSANLIGLYLFWELTSVSSFLLIGFWYEKEGPRHGAQKALLLTVAGGFCILAAFLLIWRITGTFDLAEILAQRQLILESDFYVPIVILLLLGAFAKSAQVPFHIWLPTAMEAPTPISCYLHSATMVKAGIYLIARFGLILGGTALWGGLITIVGLVSLFFGSFMALRQTDLKAILAYSTISQLGLIIALLGFGTEAAICGAIFHLWNHATFKGSLFLMTGIVDHQTGTRDVRLLKGIGKAMPVTGAIALIGAFSMAGLPPFSGFLSKEMFLDAATQAAGNLSFLGDFAILIPIVAVAASLLTFVYSVAIFGKVFCGKKTAAQPPKQPKEGSWGMLIPALALVSFNILVGFFPNFFGHYLLEPAASVVAGAPQEMHIAFWHGFNLPLLLTAIVIIGGLLVYWYYDRWWSKLKDIHWRIGANAAYEAWLQGLPKFAKKLYDCQFTGRLNDYNAVTVVASILLIGSAFLYYQLWDTIRLADFAPVDILELTLAIVTVVAAVGVAKFKRRLWAIMSLSIVGYGVSFFFVLFRAPDLALTQLLVETISLILYLLVLYKLPYGMTAVPPSTKRRKRTNAVIAVCVGATMTLLTLLAHSNKLFDSIAWYYMANSKELGGGDNIVNVILVDFRGLDTMGEITVLGLAAIGVFVVIKLGRHRLLSREGYPQGNPEEFHDTGLNLAQKRDAFNMELDPAILVGEKELPEQGRPGKEAEADAKRRK